MVDQNKIILMTQMARYENKHKKQDEKVAEYFIEDYIYINNFKTRLGITFITLCFIGYGAIKIVMKGMIFPTSTWHFIDVYIKPYFYPWLIGIVLYTILSSIVYGREHRKATKRLGEYKTLAKALRKHEKGYSNNEGATDEIKDEI